MAFAQLIGRWITGPLPPEAPGVPSRARVAQPIDWPQGEDGTIALTLTDELGEPVVLDLGGGDSLEIYIAWDLRSGPQVTLTAAAGTAAGAYVFTLVPTDTSSYSGPMVFSARAVKGALAQVVVPLGYFTISQGAALP